MINRHKILYIFIGGYHSPDHSKGGITLCQFNPETGILTPVFNYSDFKNPSFLILSPDKSFLYAVSETADYQNKNTGAVAAFQIDYSKGKLTLINQFSSAGQNPCHLALSPLRKHLFVSHYSPGSLAIFEVNADGSLKHCLDSIHYPEPSHAHSSAFFLNKHDASLNIYIQDLGRNCLYHYDYHYKNNNNIILSYPDIISFPQNTGPRLMIIDNYFYSAYLINELSNTIMVFKINQKTGKLMLEQQINLLPDNYKNKNKAAHMEISADHQYLYASNRGHDSLAVFKIHPVTRKLILIQHQSTLGQSPRFFKLISPDWLLCANQDTNSMISFKINTQTGKLDSDSLLQSLSLYQPVCIAVN